MEARLVDVPSLEGMYYRASSPLILVSSLRPPGRRAYTCAHELGHHVLGRTSHIDEVLAQQPGERASDTEEFVAECFSGFFLMPNSGVSRAFTIRGWDVRSCTPVQLYTVAGWLGVGYARLAHHMSMSVRLMQPSHARGLLRTAPKYIRSELLGEDADGNVIVVDAHWAGRAIDVEVGDQILLPPDANVRGECVKPLAAAEGRARFRAVAPGIGQFHLPSENWSAYVRVSRKGYVGRAVFRHLEDPEHA